MVEPTESEIRREGGPGKLPDSLRQDWPVAWQPVWGDKDGPWREFLSRGAQTLLFLAARLPEPLLRIVIGGLARILRRALPGRSRVAEAFLVQAFGEMDRAELSERCLVAWRHFLRVAIDIERFLRTVPEEELLDHFEVDWDPDARRICASDQGCLIVAAHVGNWELASLLVPWAGFDPFYAVAKPARNRPFSKVVQRTREQRGTRLLPRRGAMKGAAAIISAGGAIGMLLDQRARQRPVHAPFFGRQARCDRSAGVLIRRLGAPVVFLSCFQTERPMHYRARFGPCILPEQIQGVSPEDIARRINAVYEDMIREDPDQYFWLHDRYKNTPLEGSEDPEAEAVSPRGSSVVE